MSLRSLIFHNFWLKLFSLVLALLVWVFVKYRNKNDLDIRQTPIVNLATRNLMPIPVNVLTVPGDARVFKIMPEEVYVTLTGETAVLNDLSKKDLRAYVDLTEVRREDSTYRIKLHVPSGVTVLRVSPLAVNVQQVSP